MNISSLSAARPAISSPRFGKLVISLEKGERTVIGDRMSLEAIDTFTPDHGRIALVTGRPEDNFRKDINLSDEREGRLIPCHVGTRLDFGELGSAEVTGIEPGSKTKIKVHFDHVPDSVPVYRETVLRRIADSEAPNSAAC